MRALASGWLLFASLAVALAARPATEPARIAAHARAGWHPWLQQPDFQAYRREVEALYATRAGQPLWLAGGRPTRSADAALAALASAPEKGLDPRHYDAALLAAKRRTLHEASADDLALFDLALSVDLMRLLSDLHVGRANPRPTEFAVEVGERRLGLAALVEAAVRSERVRELVDEVEPRFTGYRRLRDALPRYRALARDRRAVPVVPARTLRPGEPFAEAAALGRWLVALEDLPADASVPQARYAGTLVQGVEHFQRRHGLAVDGIVGRETRRALAVPLARRVRQMELALERFRWLPAVGARRLVLVNVPAFDLHAFDAVAAPGGPALSMRVVVGKAGRTPTPVFAAEMQDVVFGPYWDVPRSITVKEMLPRLRRDPGYLAAERMEIVAGQAVLPPTPESVERLAVGEARLRQLPGPKNALGRVKFLFPNPFEVYLHDTPGQSVFLRTRRDFSHGCVRVQQPEALAAWALRDQPEWTPNRVAEAMAEPVQRRVSVRSPILVVLFYATAEAEPDGSLSFFEDLYGHDAALERALARDGR